jgi:hypothetical protein
MQKTASDSDFFSICRVHDRQVFCTQVLLARLKRAVINYIFRSRYELAVELRPRDIPHIATFLFALIGHCICGQTSLHPASPSAQTVLYGDEHGTRHTLHLTDQVIVGQIKALRIAESTEVLCTCLTRTWG